MAPDFEEHCRQVKLDVEEFLERCDLQAYAPQLEQRLGMDFDRIRFCLAKLDTSWSQLKDAERQRRLPRLLARGYNRSQMAHELGFFSPHGLHAWLKRTTGKSFEQHRGRAAA